MKLPVLQGVIRRRILANYRVQPEVVQRLLPEPMRPKRVEGQAIAGVCLIRLEQVRPEALGFVPLGIASENAAHRIAVEWDEGGRRREGVFITRRDSNSWLNHLAGGRVFPGQHGEASFEIANRPEHLSFSMKTTDGLAVRLEAGPAAALPPGSVFRSLEEASAFFAEGSAGYSVTDDPHRLDGIRLVTEGWKVAPLSVASIQASFFDDPARFPKGSIAFDHALIMRDLDHRWEAMPDFEVGRSRS